MLYTDLTLSASRLVPLFSPTSVLAATLPPPQRKQLAIKLGSRRRAPPPLGDRCALAELSVDRGQLPRGVNLRSSVRQTQPSPPRRCGGTAVGFLNNQMLRRETEHLTCFTGPIPSVLLFCEIERFRILLNLNFPSRPPPINRFSD